MQGERPIALYSRKLNIAQNRYPTGEQDATRCSRNSKRVQKKLSPRNTYNQTNWSQDNM
jgi:hypothetical protein